MGYNRWIKPYSSSRYLLLLIDVWLYPIISYYYHQPSSSLKNHCSSNKIPHFLALLYMFIKHTCVIKFTPANHWYLIMTILTSRNGAWRNARAARPERPARLPRQRRAQGPWWSRGSYPSTFPPSPWLEATAGVNPRSGTCSGQRFIHYFFT